MRYFLINIAFLLLSCGSYPKKYNFQANETSEKTIRNPYFSNPAKDYVYKADVKLYNKGFSGIFIAKKLGENHHRVVFTTEMGNKIFDFSYVGDHFIINHILPDMNKKMVVKLLETDFKTLLKENHSIKDSFSSAGNFIYKTTLNGAVYFYYNSLGKLEKIVRPKGSKSKVTYKFSDISDANAKNIRILHQGIKLSIVLKGI